MKSTILEGEMTTAQKFACALSFVAGALAFVVLLGTGASFVGAAIWGALVGGVLLWSSLDLEVDDEVR